MNINMILLFTYYLLCIKLGLWIGTAFGTRSRERAAARRDIKAREALARVHRRVVR